MNHRSAKAIEEEEEDLQPSKEWQHYKITQRFIRDGFEAYNLRPKKLDGHQFRPQ
ncbi:unnamed protein product, partial [marine sediment metagenome]